LLRFTNVTLHTAVSRINYAFSDDTDIHIAAPHLGLSMLPTYQSPSAFWADVHSHLQILPSAVAAKGRPISALVLLGENAAMPEFLTELRDALSRVSVTTEPVAANMDCDDETEFKAGTGSGRIPWARSDAVADPFWAAARGAALYARLRQEVPWNCAELDECKSSGQVGAIDNMVRASFQSKEL
jgi:hypothetical protein